LKDKEESIELIYLIICEFVSYVDYQRRRNLVQDYQHDYILIPARTAAFMPGASPPLVSTPTLVIFVNLFDQIKQKDMCLSAGSGTMVSFTAHKKKRQVQQTK
jgi:hypothetical protein